MNIKLVKELREKTGVGVGDCRKALEATSGDIDRAISHLRELGIGDFARRTDRVISQGRVMSYIHAGGRVGVLLQVNCETDFVANSEEMDLFCHEVCLQIAAMNPKWVDENTVHELEAREFIETITRQVQASGKPEAIISKIIEGKWKKYLSEVCLLDQVWIKDENKTIRDLLTTLGQKTGENVKIVRFSRFEAGTL